MAYCPRCGVEIDAEKSVCPLCGAAVVESLTPGVKKMNNYPLSDNSVIGNGFSGIRHKRFFIWELISIFFIISLISVVSINLGMDRRLSWSLYPVTAAGLVWGSLSVILFLNRMRGLMVLLVFSQISLFLWFVDFYTDGLSWFFPFALRILSLFFVIAVIVGMIIRASKTKGLNTVGIILIGLSFFCGGLENILSCHFFGNLSFTWSLIVGFSLIPAAAFTFYIHFRFTSGKKLGAWFHL